MQRRINTIGIIGISIICALAGLQWWLVHATRYPMTMEVTGYQGKVLIDGKPLETEQFAMKLDKHVIQLGEDAVLNTKLSDGSVFQVFENSRVEIQKAKTNRDATKFDLEFKLDTGEIIRNIPEVRKTTEGYSSSLFTKEVNIGVRGTQYAASSMGGVTRTMVYRGEVSLGTKSHSDVALSKGYGTLIPAGSQPQDPTPLPPPPKIESLFKGQQVESRNFDVRWIPFATEKSYLVELARDQEFSNVVYRKQVQGTTFSIGQLPYDADYYWRVASIDQRGLRGEGSYPDMVRYKHYHQTLRTSDDKVINKDLIERATKGFSTDPQLLADIAKYFSSHNDYDTAVKYYDLAMKYGKNHMDYLIGRGTALRMLGKRELAEKDFASVLSVQENSTQALYQLGLVEMDRGMTEKAIDYFYQVISHEPGHSKVHVNTALAWERLGDIERAKRHLELQKETHPDDPDVQALIEKLNTHR